MTKQPNYRFAGYTEAWEQRKLGEVAQYRNGKAHENCIDENGKYIVVNSKFISTDGEVKKFSNKKNEALFENEIAFVLSDVPNGRAIARTFWVEKNDKYTLNQRIAGITPIGETFPYFLYILMNRHPYFLAFDDGAKQTNLSVSDVMGFEAYYPKYSEQQKIGAYFRNLDHLITLQQRKLEVLKEQKKTYLKLLFPAKGQTKPVLRFAGFEDEWKEVKLGEVFKISSGFTGDSSLHSGSYKLTRIETISDGLINVKKLGYSNVAPDDSYKLRIGEILFSNINSIEHIGKVALYDKDYGLYHGINLLRLQPIDVNGIFSFYELGTIEKRNWARSHANKAVNQASINQTILSSLNLQIPSLPEQEAIGSFFQDLDKAIAKQEEKVSQLKESKQTLLRKMFI